MELSDVVPLFPIIGSRHHHILPTVGQPILLIVTATQKGEIHISDLLAGSHLQIVRRIRGCGGIERMGIGGSVAVDGIPQRERRLHAIRRDAGERRSQFDAARSERTGAVDGRPGFGNGQPCLILCSDAVAHIGPQRVVVRHPEPVIGLAVVPSHLHPRDIGGGIDVVDTAGKCGFARKIVPAVRSGFPDVLHPEFPVEHIIVVVLCILHIEIACQQMGQVGAIGVVEVPDMLLQHLYLCQFHGF